MLHSICDQIWNTQQWPQDWKKSVFIPIQKKGNVKECSNYHTVVLILHASRLCSKSFKLGFSSMWAENFQMYKLGLEKAEEPEIKQPTFIGSYRKQGNYRKTSTSALLAMLEPLKLWITANCGKFWKRWEYQTTLPASYVQVKKLQLEPHVEKLAGSKLEKEYIKAVYCHSVYLMYMQITSFKMLGWMNHKPESILPGEVSTTLDRQMIPL